MDILIIIFAIILLSQIKIGEQEDDYLSKDYSVYIKGILSIMIVFCHIQFGRVSFLPFKIFNYLGNFIVSVFFFYSGYGVLISALKKGKEYYAHFLKNRILKIIYIYLGFMIIYSIVYYLIGKINSFSELLGQIFSTELIVSHSWYIIDIIILYFVFWLLYRFINNRKKFLMLNIFCTFMIITVLMIFKFPSYWYMTLLVFDFGLFYAYNREEIEHRYSIVYYIVSIMIFLILLPSTFLIKKVMPEGIILNFSAIVIKIILYVIFVFICINSGRYIRFLNPVFYFIGKISLEIYLIHGLFEEIGKNISYISNNNFLYGIFVIFFSFIFAYVCNKIFFKVYKEC